MQKVQFVAWSGKVGFIYLKLLLWQLASQLEFQVNNSNLYDAVINLCHIRYILMPRRVLISYLIKWKECLLLFSLKQCTWLFMFSQLCRFLFTNSLLEKCFLWAKIFYTFGFFFCNLGHQFFLTKERKYFSSLFFSYWMLCFSSPTLLYFFLIDNKSFIDEKEQCVYDCKLTALETNTIKS